MRNLFQRFQRRNSYPKIVPYRWCDPYQQRNKKIIVLIIAAIAAACVVFYFGFNAKPELTLNGEAETNVEYQSTYSDEGAVAKVWKKDVSKDITVTGNVDTSKIGTYEITYTISHRNKVNSQKRIVHVVDTTAPAISLKGKEAIEVFDIEDYEEPGIEAMDNHDGDVSSQVKSTVEKLADDNYVVRYEVTDSSGNTASAERKITVKEYSEEANPRNAVYLTFDDGPSTDVTVELLDILKENDVKATFFILDYDSSKKEILQRMIDEGHTIGIHGYSHDYAEIYKSTDAFMDNIYKLRDKIKEDFGYDVYVIRFPGGSSNVVSKEYKKGIMTKLTKMVEQEGFSYFDWNIDSGDAEGNNRDKKILIRNVRDNLEKNRSNVVLMHDTSQKQTTPAAVKSIIKYGKKNGYSFYAISKDTIPVHHNVNN